MLDSTNWEVLQQARSVEEEEEEGEKLPSEEIRNQIKQLDDQADWLKAQLNAPSDQNHGQDWKEEHKLKRLEAFKKRLSNKKERDWLEKEFKFKEN